MSWTGVLCGSCFLPTSRETNRFTEFVGLKVPYFGFAGLPFLIQAFDDAGVEQYKRVYKLDQQTGQMSNTGLMLSHGTAKKLFAMDNISNSPITPDEFDRWRKVLESEYQNFPNIDYIEKRVEKLNQQRNHANTKEEMSHMLQRKTALRTIPTNIAEARAKLSFERDRATATGNKEDIERIENEMARLDEVSKSRTKQSSAMEQFAEINRRNRDRDLLRGNRLADDERASKGEFVFLIRRQIPADLVDTALSPAIPSPSKASGSERGISPAPGASPQLSIASGAPVGIGISLGEAQREGTPATDSQQQNGTPSLSIVVDKPKNPSTFDFDDDLPPPADELLI